METEQPNLKLCLTCRVKKDTVEFGSCRAAKDGMYNDCAVCRDAMYAALMAKEELRYQDQIKHKGHRWGTSAMLARYQDNRISPLSRFNRLVKHCQHLSDTEVGLISNITTFDDYWEIIKDDMCFYCGGPILCGQGYCLDRIDSSKWYVKDNVRPCCGRCNQAKNDMSEDEFRVLVWRINQHWLGVPTN